MVLPEYLVSLLEVALLILIGNTIQLLTTNFKIQIVYSINAFPWAIGAWGSV
jgi:hypothetical protein